jgi:hypothetical protein
MNKLLLAAGALIAALSLLSVPVADAASKKPSRSVAARTALCRADCSPAKFDQATGVGIHGIYRSYHKNDPHLTSIDGRRQYAECVKHCTDPLPAVYVQRPIFAMGMTWFGKTADSCLSCHAPQHK